VKNRHIESKKQLAKLYHRNMRGDEFTGGIIVRYLYADMAPNTLTYWDDTVFLVNDYRVALWWVHPRHQYHELVQEEARQRLGDLRPQRSPLDDMTPNYKKPGRSRKKMLCWTQRPDGDEYRRYFERLLEMERQVAQEIPFEIRPSMKIAWHDWCRGVNLCVPFEVRSEADLMALSRIARRLVKRESTLADEFGDYVYGQVDWLNDCKTVEEQKKSRIWMRSPNFPPKLMCSLQAPRQAPWLRQ
jgi:hypothetical protein